jgi:cell division septal protein FtsQ
MFSTRPSRQQRLNAVQRSLRVSQYEQKKERVNKIKSIYIVIFLVVAYFVYLCLFSSIFRLQYVNISGNDSIPETEIKDLIFKQFEKRRWFMFPSDNYFIFSETKLRQQLEELYNLKKLSINRDDKNTIVVNIEELPGRVLWITQSKTFLIDSNGIVIREVPNLDDSLKSAPILYDLSNVSANVRDHVINEDLVNLCLEIKQKLAEYNVPAISIDHFSVDGHDANYIKLITPQKLEIHISPKLSTEQQFLKLRRSLEENKIELSKIQYINLRVEDQVIYK